MTEKGLKYLTDIINAIKLIEDFTVSTTSFSDFLQDLKTQSAVERQLGIIGEAVNKFDALHPELSLKKARQIVGLRNRIIHAYDAIDPSIIWTVVKRHLSPLLHEVSTLIQE